MELRLEHYYRVNYVPVFMTERTPGESREDLWELLESVDSIIMTVLMADTDESPGGN